MTDPSNIVSPTVLEANGFCLRPLREQDITPRYVEMLNNPRVNRFLEVRWIPQTHETVRKFVASFYQEVEKQIWGITAGENNLFIGTTTLYQINRNYRSAEIGLMIGDESYWGKGASAAVLTLIIEYAFNVLKLRRLSGGSYALNYGMNFTYKRLGFRCEGRYVKAGVSEAGEYLDSFRWAILEDEWRTRANRRP